MQHTKSWLDSAPPSFIGEDWGDEFNHVPSYLPLKETSRSCSKGLLEKEDAAQQVDFHWYGLQTPGNRLRQVRGLPKFAQLSSHRSDSNCSPLGRTQLFCESLLLLGTHILYWVEGEPAQPNLHMNQGYKRGALLLSQVGAPFSV